MGEIFPTFIIHTFHTFAIHLVRRDRETVANCIAIKCHNSILSAGG